jgi:hypothetical protein
MQLGKIEGFALIVLGVMLFGLQTMIYMTPKQVVNGAPALSTAKVAHETYPVPGILGVASLMAALAVLATRRRADELGAKTRRRLGTSHFARTEGDQARSCKD